MTIVQSTVLSGLEAALRARIAIDPSARKTAASLSEKLIQLSIEDQNYYILFEDESARVANYSENTPDLTITGTFIDLGTFFISNHGDVDVVGDVSLLESVRSFLVPDFSAADTLAEKSKMTAEYCIAATKSALEGLASELTTNKVDHERIEELEEQLRESQKTILDLEDRLSNLEKN